MCEECAGPMRRSQSSSTGIPSRLSLSTTSCIRAVFQGAVRQKRDVQGHVCPELAPPAEPCFWAFTYSVPDVDARPSFVIAGSGEAAEGYANYTDRIVSLGDVSPDGLRAKAEFVLGEMERRMGGLGFGWKNTSAVQVYTVHDIFPFVASELGRRGAMRTGLTWHFNRPPVVDLDYEMDCRGVTVERVTLKVPH